MSPLTTFFNVLLSNGRALLQVADRPAPGEREQLVALLRSAFDVYRLDVAGPPLDFDADTALAAAALVHQACLALVSHADSVAELERSLVMPGPPRSPAQHLSADLLLRFLPQVHRRARALDPGDPLVMILEKVLRQWPLSGVLADIPDGPVTPPAFDGHPGLLLLYAERLGRRDRPAWLPAGPGREFLELVWDEG
jgi:hypothetical protein